MARRALICENTHLSETKTEPADDQTEVIQSGSTITGAVSGFAINCNVDLEGAVRAFVEAGVAPATRRAYAADLDHFAAWGGILRATEAQLAAYLAAYAITLSVATLTRRRVSISVPHEAWSYSSSAKSPLVRVTMGGIRCDQGRDQLQAKPLVKDDLLAVLAAMGSAPRDLRDRALLLIGFAGGFRHSELIALNCTDIEAVRQGLVITLLRSKTYEEGGGRKLGDYRWAGRRRAPALRYYTGWPPPASSKGRSCVPLIAMAASALGGSRRRRS